MADRIERTVATNIAEEAFFAQFENFTADEMRCKCGTCAMPINDPEFVSFMRMAQGLRDFLDFPWRLNSGYRCSRYNDQIYVDQGSEPGEHLDGPHTKGAMDIGVSFERMYLLVKGAMAREMGVGVKQHGPVAKRYVHLDNLGSRFWTYA